MFPRQPAGRRRSAAVIVEFAFMVPIILAVVFAIVEHGRYFMIIDLLRNAAREGARYAVVSTEDLDPIASKTRIQDHTAMWIGTQSNSLVGFDKYSNIDVFAADANGNNLGSWENAAFGDFIAVRITGQYNAILPQLTFMANTVDFDVIQVQMSEAN